jgi:hypothetical protein
MIKEAEEKGIDLKVPSHSPSPRLLNLAPSEPLSPFLAFVLLLIPRPKLLYLYTAHLVMSGPHGTTDVTRPPRQKGKLH